MKPPAKPRDGGSGSQLKEQGETGDRKTALSGKHAMAWMAVSEEHALPESPAVRPPGASALPRGEAVPVCTLPVSAQGPMGGEAMLCCTKMGTGIQGGAALDDENVSKHLEPVRCLFSVLFSGN